MEAEGVEQQKQAPAADRHAIPSPRQAAGGGGPQSVLQALQIPSQLGLSAPMTCGAASKLTLPFWGGVSFDANLPLMKHAIRVLYVEKLKL
jgi:hypothetical protein